MNGAYQRLRWQLDAERERIASARWQYEHKECGQMAVTGDDQGALREPPILVPLKTVTALANWLLSHRDATIADVMAEFDVTYDQAIAALYTAKTVITRLERERP